MSRSFSMSGKVQCAKGRISGYSLSSGLNVCGKYRPYQYLQMAKVSAVWGKRARIIFPSATLLLSLRRPPLCRSFLQGMNTSAEWKDMSRCNATELYRTGPGGKDQIMGGRVSGRCSSTSSDSILWLLFSRILDVRKCLTAFSHIGTVLYIHTYK